VQPRRSQQDGGKKELVTLRRKVRRHSGNAKGGGEGKEEKPQTPHLLKGTNASWTGVLSDSMAGLEDRETQGKLQRVGPLQDWDDENRPTADKKTK